MDDKTRADEISDVPDGGIDPRTLTPVRRAHRTDRPEPLPGRFTLSPINKRRWQNFKANRRGYWSLWIFLVLFFVTLFAEFIANDKPLYSASPASRISRSSLPIRRPTFGGDFETAADYRDPYLAEVDRRQRRQHDLAADPLFLRYP